MPVWTGAAMIALLGSATLTGMTFAPPDGARRVAAVVPPWVTAGVPDGVALVAVRWGGRVMILDTGGNGAVVAGLLAQGYWVMDATGAGACGKGERVR